MKSKRLLNYYIKPVWDDIDDIREKIDSLLAGYDSELIVISVHVASELIENAVKYGSFIKNDKGIDFSIDVDDHRIEIKVVNKISSYENFETLKSTIEQIKLSDNPMELYTNRIMALLSKKTVSKSQLGLFRMAGEGNFFLDYQLENDILTVSATKKL